MTTHVDDSLYTRAMLAGLRISAWTARKYDRKVSQEVADSHGASIDAGRYNKHLMPTDASTYKALNQHVAAIRQVYYDNTLPWSDDGWRMLPIKNYQRFTDAMREGKHKFDQLLREFLADYPALREEAKRRYNGLFSDSDYPTNPGDRYAFDVEYNPVPSGGDFRVALSDEEVKMLSAQAEARSKRAFDAAQADAVKRLYECVSHIHERLTATTKGAEGEMKPGIFRDSLIENARDLCEVLVNLNLKEDPKLESLRQQTELLAMTEPDTLRENADVRVQTAKDAQAILDAMTATYGKFGA